MVAQANLKPSPLSGQVALVTGGGTGIGLMIAEAFADSGAKVYITGRRLNVLEKAANAYNSKGSHPGSLVPLVLDVIDTTSINNAVETISKTDGKLDLLVNNAGIATPLNDPEYMTKKFTVAEKGELPYSTDTPEGFESIFVINSIAPYFVSTAFLNLLRKGAESKLNEDGLPTSCIINISSVSATARSSPTGGCPAYGPSKAALDALTIQLAADFARKKIPVRVNAIAPGPFPSDIIPAEFFEIIKTQPIPGLAEPIPVKRIGTSEEMGTAALYLATVGYVNGEILKIDGGITLVNA